MLLIPAFAFMEACIGIGLFVSGLFLVVACSIIYLHGWVDIQMIMLLAMLGASLGDHTGFYVGRLLGPGIEQLSWVQKHRDKLAKTEALARNYGRYAIFIGRFIPAIRSLLPAMLGMSGFDRVRYSALDLAACALWALALGAIVSGAAHLFASAS